MLGVRVGVRSGLGEEVPDRSRVLERDWGRAREDSLILRSPKTWSGFLDGTSTVARLPPFRGLPGKGGAQMCCEDESEGVVTGVARVAAPGTPVTLNHSLITLSLVTLASSIACPWILLSACPNSFTTTVALMVLSSRTDDRLPAGVGDRRVGGGI